MCSSSEIDKSPGEASPGLCRLACKSAGLFLFAVTTSSRAALTITLGPSGPAAFTITFGAIGPALVLLAHFLELPRYYNGW